MEVTLEALARFFEVTSPLLNERQRRVVAGAAASMLGRGGQARVTEASGMSRNTVIAGMREVDEGVESSTRVRAPGAGPKPLIETQPGLLEALDELVHPTTRGTPMSLLRWTSKSTAKLAAELGRKKFAVSPDTVGRLLKGLGYSLQAPSKQKEGTRHPDRDAQFRYLNARVQISNNRSRVNGWTSYARVYASAPASMTYPGRVLRANVGPRLQDVSGPGRRCGRGRRGRYRRGVGLRG